MIHSNSLEINEMEKYFEYALHLENLIFRASTFGFGSVSSEAGHALNGGAFEALRSTVRPELIKKSGAFFTTEAIAREAIDILAKKIGGPVFDPACGAGDLLLRWAENLPVCGSLADTLNSWGTLIRGIDINSAFVAVAKRRILLQALSHGGKWKLRRNTPLDGYFPMIGTGDYLKMSPVATDATLVMNPPFNQQAVNEKWAAGRTSLAAVFFMKGLGELSPGQRIVGILPEVLRSGTRYDRWRASIHSLIDMERFVSLGKFSKKVDVDIFVVQGLRKWVPSPWAAPALDEIPRLDSICDVRVGTVVPHRDEIKGPSVRYLRAASVPSEGEFSGGERRKVSSRTVQTPFVVVRRTSSPSDKVRPVATLVTGLGPVALENHLISIRPHDGSLNTCKKIYDLLRSQDTRAFLDETIRCRHFTTSALKSIPLKS